MRSQMIKIIGQYKSDPSINSDHLKEILKLERMCYNIGESDSSIITLVADIKQFAIKDLANQQHILQSQVSDKHRVIEYCFEPIVSPLHTKRLASVQYEYQQTLESMTIIQTQMSPFVDYLYKP
jgi:hypothetical protein